jgi:cytochrome c553
MNKLLTLLSALFVAACAHAQEVKGSARSADNKAAMCMGCHGILGYHTGYPEVHQVPKLSGQGEMYLLAALRAYQAGERKHPSMSGVASTLSEQDMAELAAYYARNGPTQKTPATVAPGPASVIALVSKGNCAACHGANFSQPINPVFPKLAGQHSDYLYVALKAYKTEGVRQIGRAHPVMSGIAKQFTNDELKELANYIGSLPGELQTVQQSRFR